MRYTHESLLHDLLAVIHRDGGHYTGKHGVEKSTDDAIDIVIGIRAKALIEEGEKLPSLEEESGEQATNNAMVPCCGYCDGNACLVNTTMICKDKPCLVSAQR